MKNGLMGGVAAIAVIAAAGASAPAAAQEAFNWTGFYLGAHLGYGGADFEGGIEINAGTPESRTFIPDVDGFAVGFQGGYNHQFDLSGAEFGLVAGLEADVTFLNNWNDFVRGGGPDKSAAAEGELLLLGSIRARLGVAIDRALVYATGGVAFPNGEADVFGSPETTGFHIYREFNDVGGVFGGGIEYAVTDMISIRGEGLYYIFGDDQAARFAKNGSEATDSNTGDFHELDDAWVARLGVNVRFDSFM